MSISSLNPYLDGHLAPCPGCDHDVPVDDLCGHDDAVTGPLCSGCCEIEHGAVAA